MSDKAVSLLERIVRFNIAQDREGLTDAEKIMGVGQLQVKYIALKKLYKMISKEQKGRAGRPFDHERKLHFVLHECRKGLHGLIEERLEWEAPPSLPPQPILSYVRSEDGRWTLPQVISQERCRPTPAAGPYPLHQGASQSVYSLPPYVPPSNGAAYPQGSEVSGGWGWGSEDVSLNDSFNNMSLNSNTERNPYEQLMF